MPLPHSNIIQRFETLVNQPDFRVNPLRALWKRLQWRIYWWFYKDPLLLSNWYGELKIFLPRTGNAAQVFYRKHSSVEIVRVMEEVLQVGDIVIDIGAHIGEYTLIAAYLVGFQGKVYAVEPQPQAAKIIAVNARLNNFSNVQVIQSAVGKISGMVEFGWDSGRWGGLVVPKEGNLRVRSITLDELVEDQKIPHVHLMKIDAAGNERDVLLGGRKILTNPCAPVIICKLYNPIVVRERFGYEACDIVRILHGWGYQITALTYRGEILVTVDNCYALFNTGEYGLPLKAWRPKC